MERGLCGRVACSGAGSEGWEGLLPEGHQPLVGSPTRTEVQLPTGSPQLAGYEATASAGRHEQVNLESGKTDSLCSDPNILRLEANRVCIYISATEGRRG